MQNQALIKTGILGIFSAVSGLIYGLILKNFFASGSTISLILLALATAVLLAAFIIQIIASANFWLDLISVSASALLMLSVFASKANILMIVAAAFIVGLVLTARHQAALELKNNLNIRFFKISQSAAKLISSAVAIFSIITYLSLLNFQNPMETKKVLANVLRPIEPITHVYIKGFTVNDSISQLAARLMPASVRLQPEAVQQDFINQASARLTSLFSSYARVVVQPSDSLVDIFYKATVAKMLQLPQFAQLLILAAAAVVIFILVKFFLIFINWFAVLLADGVYNLLISTGFLKIVTESREKKIIKLE